MRERPIQRRFWFAVMDLFDALRWRKAALWALVKASDCTDWGVGADCSGGSGEEPF